MKIEANQKLLHYRLIEKIGEGGMGVVWKAIDTKLDREVAIKALPEAFTADAERLERFQREARLLASLNHPNIAGIHALEEGPSGRFLAMELVPGEDLEARLERGPLPLDEALEVARQIAAALEAAHANGVIHRDLKPANVKLASLDEVKVLDFGLAKATDPLPDSASFDMGISPTLTSAGTRAGMILGTAAYMSPEQARGQAVDKRADLWSFGCVLYECLTGVRLFAGETASDSMAAVLTKDPDWSALPAATPPLIRALLARCLARDPKKRLQDAGDVRLDLELAIEDPSGETLGLVPATGDSGNDAPRKPARSRLLPWAAAAGTLILGVVATWILKPPADEAAPPPKLRFEIMLDEGRGFSSNYNRVVTISPDSRTIAYLAEGGASGASYLWLRSLDRTEPWSVPDTTSARAPAFSYDSRQIAFWESGHIKRARIEGGRPIVVGALRERPMGIHWASDDFIYVGRADRGIWRVPSSSGELEPVLELNEGEYAHGPELLPGGEWLLFSLSRGVRAWHDGSIVAQSLETNERRVLVQRGREARYLRNGYLTYVQDNTLFAAPFDLDTMQISGAAAAMETNVHTSAEDETGAAGYDVSDNGVLAFAPPSGSQARSSRLTFVDREGNENPLPLGPRRFGNARLSPQGTRVAAQINDIEGTHIWIISVDRDGAQRLTSDGRNTSPVWSHDGRHVYFASVRDGTSDIWRRPADLSGPAEKVLELVGAELPESASSDGQWLYYSKMSPSNSDIARVSLVGDPKVEVLLDSLADESDARVSPDGRFFAFQSDETGRWDIHVLEIASKRRWIISSSEGYAPLWTRDGNRILFSANSGDYHVDVRTSPEFSTGEPVRSFDVVNRILDASRDGERRLVALDEVLDDRTETRPRITVALNWFDEIEERIKGSNSR